MGILPKKKIRDIAKFYKLDVAQKPDSQDICFIPDGNYRDFIKKNISKSAKKGNIETEDGKILGKHNGIYDFTIGQRKGIGVGGVSGKKNHKPFYVIDIDTPSNKVIIGPREKLKKYYIYLKDLNFFCKVIPSKKFNAFVKVRSRKSLISAKIEVSNSSKKTGIVQLLEPEYGIAPGQACVFYNNFKKVIGGGWITAGEKRHP